MGIADIYEIMGRYADVVKTYDRILDLLEAGYDIMISKQ